MDEQGATTSITELLRFFIPLALTSMLTMFTHTIISSGLARTVNPTGSIAAFAVALGLAEIFEAPVVLLRQVVLAFVRDSASLRTIQRVYAVTVAVLMVAVLAIGFVPVLSLLVLQRILGVSNELLPATLTAFRVMLILPMVSGFRCIYQGVLLSRRSTALILNGMLFRVGLMALLVFSFNRFGFVTGALVGAIAIIGGVVVEGAVAFYFGRNLIPTNTPEKQPPRVWKFYLPLISSALLASTAKPFLNAGLARTPDSAQALAAFSIAASLAWLIISPAQNLHQAVMVFGRSRSDQAQMKKFSLGYALIASAILLVFAFTPMGPLVLRGGVGIPANLLAPTLIAMRILAFLPLVLAWQDYNIGLLLLSRSTGLVGLSKVCNLLITVAFVLLFSHRFVAPAVAPLAQLVGFTCSGLLLHLGRVRGLQGTHNNASFIATS